MRTYPDWYNRRGRQQISAMCSEPLRKEGASEQKFSVKDCCFSNQRSENIEILCFRSVITLFLLDYLFLLMNYAQPGNKLILIEPYFFPETTIAGD